MHYSLYFLAISGLLFSTSPIEATASCKPIDGAREMAAGTSKIRFLIIGEVHGTNEIPALFGELACEIARGRSITVALEFPATSAIALNKYLSSNGDAQSRNLLLRSPIWQRSTADGRSSKAMLALIERLRQLRASGAKIRLAGFQPTDVVNLDQHYYELAMASNWSRIADEAPESLNLILVGQIHAIKSPSQQLPFAPAASHLKPADVLSLRSEPISGEAWNCREEGCGVHVLSGTPGEAQYVARFAAETGGFDGVYSIGTRYSASEPALLK